MVTLIYRGLLTTLPIPRAADAAPGASQCQDCLHMLLMLYKLMVDLCSMSGEVIKQSQVLENWCNNWAVDVQTIDIEAYQHTHSLRRDVDLN